MIRIAVVDDVEGDANTIAEYCNKYAQEKSLQFNIETFNNGLDFVTAGQFDYDVIMLDIKMPYMNGLQTAQKIRETNSSVVIVFITSMQQYAIHGYEVQATDFIVKPVKYNVFMLKLERILSIVEKNQGRKIAIKTNRLTKYLKVSEILYVESQQHKLIYHTQTEDLESWGTMKEASSTLQPFGFALCNSGCIVNLKCVEELVGNVIVVGGKQISISRTMKKDFINALTTRAFN